MRTGGWQEEKQLPRQAIPTLQDKAGKKASKSQSGVSFKIR